MLIFLSGHNIGRSAAPKPLCFPGRLRPADAPSLISLNMSFVGHVTCTMIIVHVCTVLMVRVSFPALLMFGAIQVGGPVGEAPWKSLPPPGTTKSLTEVP